MEVSMDIGQWTVIGVSVLFMAWFLAGAAINRKLGDQALRWVQVGTKPIGRLSEARRIRGSAVQLTMKDAAAPFRQLDLIVALEPRENPPFWLYHHFKGKRDELVIQGQLRSAPKQGWEVTWTSSRPLGDTEAAGDLPPRMIQASTGTYTLAPTPKIEPPTLDLLERFLSKNGHPIRQLVLKRSSPHLQVRLRLAPLLKMDPQEFIKDLQGIMT